MKPHSRAHHSVHTSKQGSASEETPPGEPSIIGTSSEGGSSAEAALPKRGLGRGNLLKLGQSSVFIPGKSKVDYQCPGRSSAYPLGSSIRNVTKDFHEMHVEKKQDVPTPTERLAPTTRSILTEKISRTTKAAATEKPESRAKPASTETRASTEERPSTARIGRTERHESRAKPTSTEERPSVARLGRTERHESRAKPTSTEERPSTARIGRTERHESRAKPTSTEERPSTARIGRTERHESRTKPASTEGRPSLARLGRTERHESRAKPASTEERPSTARIGRTERHESRAKPTSTEERPSVARLGRTERPEQTTEEFLVKRKSVTLLTNYVRLKTDPDITVYEYEITFSPDLEYTNFRYRLLYEQFKGKRDILCYDGSSKLFTPQKITDNLEEFVLHHPVDESLIIMSVKLKKKAEPKDCAIVYNTLFNNCSRILRFTRFGNKYFDAEEAIDIPQHKLEIWPGYVTTIDEFDGGILLRCDINHRILRTETVLDILMNLSTRGREYVKAMALRDLIGQCVLTRYNNNLYRIDDIDWTKSPLSTFTLKNGEEISFLEYYKRQYNIDITNLKQPLLINMAKDGTGSKKNLICLVPEICYMTGLNDKMRTDIKVMKDIARYTRITPNQRIYAFKKFLGNIESNEEIQNLFQKWGLKIIDDLVQVKAKNLEPETLVFGKNVTLKTVNYDWMKSLRDLNVYRSNDIKDWIIFYPSRNYHVADDFTNLIKKIGPGLGILVQDPKKISLPDDRIETYISSLRTNIKKNTQIVVCICPTAREDRYNAIKKLCCKEIPIPSQIVNVITLSREDRMRPVVQNIALQMNHKIGGAGWSIQIPFNRTMVCGIDVYHDKYHASGSVGAFVASSNDDYTEWFSRTNLQAPKEELISGVVSAFMAALSFYHKKNGVFPDRIVVFRDGVSDGQLDACLHYEVPQFLKAFKIAKYDYRPNFVYIIVQKRIATKLYRTVDEEVENPRPGGVVDSVITKKGRIDFYLVSQLVRSGTASPTHYIVIYDNSSASPDYIQRFTYKFCHLYYNWPGTIRVPAPCQYAHKLAYLVGQNIKCAPDESLENKLFYL